MTVSEPSNNELPQLTPLLFEVQGVGFREKIFLVFYFMFCHGKKLTKSNFKSEKRKITKSNFEFEIRKLTKSNSEFQL